MTSKEIQDRIDLLCKELGEHCDSVRLFVTFQEGGGNTSAADSGCGNFYAQLGQVSEWISIQEQYQRNWAIKKDNPETT